MKRFVSRHLSVRREYSYLPLSTSDPQLHIEKTSQGNIVHKERNSESVLPRDKNARKRRWFYLRRRKKKRDNEVGVHGEKASAEFEVAVEVSPSAESALDEATQPETDTLEFNEHSVSLPTVNKATSLGATCKDLPCRFERRFAICEELEREIIMEDGTNLRKSRKNLVIRQVLHDLLLL